MKTLRISYIILTILFLESLALAGTWIEDFNDGKADGWNEIVGEWQVEKDAYAETGWTQYAKTTLGEESWADYTVECDVTLVETFAGAGSKDCAGLLVRADKKGENGFRFWIRTDMSPQLSKWVNDKYEHIDQNLPVNIKIGETYHLKVILEGNKHQYFINDEKVVEYEDKEGFRKSGGIGFITYQAYPHFDNLVISGPEIPSLAVKPESKLPICWGRLKRTTNYELRITN